MDEDDEAQHGLTCECGQTFQTPEALTEHATVEAILDEVQRIGGDKYHQVVESNENNAHAGGIREFADQQGIEMVPENASEIAKKLVAHYVRRHDEYMLGEGGA